MSQLRARTAAARQARRAAILRSARGLLERAGPAGITMAAVARKARLAKGTVFLYFPTREALFLDLLDDLLDEWLGRVHEAAALESVPWTSARLAALMTETLAERPLVARLLPLYAATLAPLADPARVAAFEHRLLRRCFSTGALLEQRLSLARRGDGVQLLLFARAMVAGLQRTDADLRAALTVLFNGFHRRGA